MAELYISNACDRGRKFLESNTSNASAHKLGFLLLEPSSLQGTISLVIVIFLCALICSLCFDSILRYTLRWTRNFAVESSEDFATISNDTETRTMFVLEIPTLIYAAPGSKPPDFGTDCPICLGDFAEGEQLRVLPNCNHGFHAQCIDTWLLSRSSCPTCRRGVLDSENGSFQRGNSTASCAVDGQDSSSFPSASVGAADNSSAIFIYERVSNLRYAFALGGYAI